MRDETSSGGLLANDCLVHFSVSSLPFGGVGKYIHRQGSAFLGSQNNAVTDSVKACIISPCVRNITCTCMDLLGVLKRSNSSREQGTVGWVATTASSPLTS